MTFPRSDSQTPITSVATGCGTPRSTIDPVQGRRLHGYRGYDEFDLARAGVRHGRSYTSFRYSVAGPEGAQARAAGKVDVTSG